MIPVVLIHNGYQDYLKYSIRQAAQKNPVFLIGDTNPATISRDELTFVHFDSLAKDEYDLFAKQYLHLNTTPESYELFCYLRWFLLKNFMEKNQLDVVFYIDSDVLFFENATKEWEKFNQFDFTLLHRTAGISSFVTKDGINNFCNMLMYLYSHKNEYDFMKIASHWEVRRRFELPGGVCDMTLLEYFHYHSEFGGGPGVVGEMMTIINDSTYDHNINVADQGFEFEGGLKKAKIIDGQVFVYNQRLKKDIKFNSLHFQGAAKKHMETVYERLLEK